MQVSVTRVRMLGAVMRRCNAYTSCFTPVASPAGCTGGALHRSRAQPDAPEVRLTAACGVLYGDLSQLAHDTKVLCQMKPVYPMPPPLQAGLRANGKGKMVDAGFQALVAFTVAAGQGLPPMPDDVLRIWALTLATGRIMVLQGSMAFIRQARRAGKSDEQIRRALLLDE